MQHGIRIYEFCSEHLIIFLCDKLSFCHARLTISTSLSTIINQVSCYQIMKVLPKRFKLSDRMTIVLCIRTRDISYLCMLYVNLLKPTVYVMHQQFNIQQLYALPTLYLCVLYLSENKQRLVLLTA